MDREAMVHPPEQPDLCWIAPGAMCVRIVFCIKSKVSGLPTRDRILCTHCPTTYSTSNMRYHEYCTNIAPPSIMRYHLEMVCACKCMYAVFYM